MADGHLAGVLRRIRRMIHGSDADQTDSQLLERFAAHGDEAAFEDLLRRYGPLVLGLCRRLLSDAHDADDAFQATFLVLARKAGSIRRHESVGSWLYGVAYRVARKVHATAARRRLHERQAAEMMASDSSNRADAAPEAAAWRELRPVLDAELQRLPEKYRAPLVLCYLEGRTNEEAARVLGWPVGSMSRRLGKARELLRQRLAGRGVALAVAALPALLVENTLAAVPPALRECTLRGAVSFAAGRAAGEVSMQAITLAEGALRTMLVTKLKMAALLLLVLGVTGTGAGLYLRGDAAPQPGKPAERDAAAVVPPLATDRYGDPLPRHALRRLGTVRFRQGAELTGVRFLPDGRTLATTSADQTVRLWEAASGKELTHFRRPAASSEWPHALTLPDVLAPDGRTVASVDTEPDQNVPHPNLRLWHVATGKPGPVIPLPGNGAENVPVFAADSKSLAVIVRESAKSHMVQRYDAATGQELKQLVVPPRTDDQGEALPVVISHLAISPDGRLVGATTHQGDLAKKVHLLAYLWGVESGKAVPLALANAHEMVLGRFCFSPDSRLLADVVRWREKGSRVTVRLWQTATGQAVRDLLVLTFPPDTLEDFIPGLRFAPSGQTLAVLTGPKGEQVVRLFDVPTGKELPPCTTEASVEAWAFAPDSRTLAVGLDDATVRLWDVTTGKELHRLNGFATSKDRNADYLRELLAFAPDGASLTAVSGGLVRRWAVDTGKELRAVDAGHEEAVVALALSANGKQAVTMSGDRTARLWDTSTGKQLHVFAAPAPEEERPERPAGARAVAFAADGRLVALGWPSGAIQLCDTGTGMIACQLKGHTLGITSLAFIPEGTAAVSADEHGEIKWWDVRTGKLMHEYDTPGEFAGRPVALALSADGNALAAVEARGLEASLRVWEVATRKLRRQFTVKLDPVGDPDLRILGQPKFNGAVAVAFAPDGRSVAWTVGDTVRLWDLAQGKELRRFGAGNGPVIGAEFSPDGKYLTVTGRDGTLHLWEAATGTLLGQLVGHRGGATCAAFAAQAGTLATGGADTTVLLWDVTAFVAEHRPTSGELSAAQLAQLWEQLGGDPDPADRAQWQLVHNPRQAVPWVRERVRVVPAVDAARLRRLVDDLESDRFAVRKAATDELARLGELAEGAVRRRLVEGPSLEAKQRLEQLLSKLAGPMTEPERLRTLRAIEVLERIGTPEAREVLRELATGAPEARLTRDAKRAVERLEKHP